MRAWERSVLTGPIPVHVLCTLVNNAARHGWTEMLLRLLAFGAPIDGNPGYSKNSRRSIFCALEGGYMEVVQVLLDRAAYTNGVEFLAAAKEGHSRIVRIPLDHGVKAKNTVAAAAIRVYLMPYGFFSIKKRMRMKGLHH